jgi:hypothetical protein
VQKEFKARAVDRGEIVSELGKSETAARNVRSAVCHSETRRAPATHLAVIDMRKARARAIVVAREDYRGGAVAHLDHIDELSRILRRPMRVEEDRARFRPDDRDRPRAGAQQALSEHQGIGEAGASLTKLDKGAAVVEHLCDLADVRRHQARRCRGMTDQVREIMRRKAGFAERAPHGSCSEFVRCPLRGPSKRVLMLRQRYRVRIPSL